MRKLVNYEFEDLKGNTNPVQKDYITDSGLVSITQQKSTKITQ